MLPSPKIVKNLLWPMRKLLCSVDPKLKAQRNTDIFLLLSCSKSLFFPFWNRFFMGGGIWILSFFLYHKDFFWERGKRMTYPKRLNCYLYQYKPSQKFSLTFEIFKDPHRKRYSKSMMIAFSTLTNPFQKWGWNQYHAKSC